MVGYCVCEWVEGEECLLGGLLVVAVGGCLDTDLCTEWFHKQALAAQ